MCPNYSLPRHSPVVYKSGNHSPYNKLDPVLTPMRIHKQSGSLTEHVYQEIRRAIITGQIAGGSRLNESSLAAELSVSRTPVREALHKLALEKLLHAIPRAGYIVEEMSDHDIRDLFKTRMAIEKLAATWAMEHVTANELQRMEENLQRALDVLQSGLTQEMVDLDTAFHGIIYRASRSKNLMRICNTLGDHTLKYRIALMHIPELAIKTCDDHMAIFNALRDKDLPRLKQVIESHMQQAQTSIIRQMQRLREEAFTSSPQV